MVRPKRVASNVKKQKSTEQSVDSGEHDAVATAAGGATTTPAAGGVPPLTASEETSELNTQNTNETRSNKEDDVPPIVRKRRLASLNAEFLVHYCSSSNNHNNGNEQPPPTNNNNHSGNSHHAHGNNNATAGAGGNNKRRRRTISSRATTTNDDESTNRGKRRPTGVKKSTKESVDAEEVKEEQKEVADQPVVKRKASQRGGKRNVKKQESEEDEKSVDEEEEEEVASKESEKKGRRNGRGAVKKAKETEAPAPSLASTRPRREAGMRASAMIIQTNEIEKSNRAYHQFVHSSTNNNNGTAEKKLKNSPKNNSTNKETATNNKKQPNITNNHTFQVPQSVAVFAASQRQQQQAIVTPDQSDTKPIMTGGGNHHPSNITGHVNLLSKKKQLSAAYSSQNNMSATNTFPLRQISTCTTMGSLSALAPTPGATVGNVDNDSSSNEVQIVAEKCGRNLLNGVKSAAKHQAIHHHQLPAALIKTALTVESLAEHNRLNGTTSGTNGTSTFSNHTKEYITRWASEHAKYLLEADEVPFKADYVPIESFGDKILNEPQFVLKQGGGGAAVVGSVGNRNVPVVAEKNLVASSMGKTNLTGNSKLNGAVVGGGANCIKPDPHQHSMKLNEGSILNSEQKIKPAPGLKHTASFPNLATGSFSKGGPHHNVVNAAAAATPNTMAQLNSLANAFNGTLQKQPTNNASSKSTRQAVSAAVGPSAKISSAGSNKMNEAEAAVTEANVNKLVAAAFAAAAVNAAAAAAVVANVSSTPASSAKPVSNHQLHHSIRFPHQSTTSHQHHHLHQQSGRQSTSSHHSAPSSHLSLFQQHLNNHLSIGSSNNNNSMSLPLDHHSIKSAASMPSLHNPSSCPSSVAVASNIACSNNRSSSKQDMYHPPHHAQSFPLISHHHHPDAHSKIIHHPAYMSHHHHHHINPHAEFLKSIDHQQHHHHLNHNHQQASMSQQHSSMPHHHHHHPNMHVDESPKIKAEKQTYMDHQQPQQHHHHHMPPPVINVENVNFYGTLPMPLGATSSSSPSNKFNLSKSGGSGVGGLCSAKSGGGGCDSCCALKTRHQSLSPPSHRSCSGNGGAGIKNHPSGATAAATSTSSRAQTLTAESMALNLAKLFNQAAAVASSARMDSQENSLSNSKLLQDTKSNSNLGSSSHKASHTTNNKMGGNESSMHAEKDETDSVVSVSSSSSSSSSVKQISVHSKSDVEDETRGGREATHQADYEEETKNSVRSSNSSVNLIVDESNTINNNQASSNSFAAHDEDTNLTTAKKSSQLQIKESEQQRDGLKDSSSPPSITLVSTLDSDEPTKLATKLISIDSCDNSSSMQAFTAAGDTLAASSPSNADKEPSAVNSRSEEEREDSKKQAKSWKTTAAPIIETEEETTEYENGSSEPSKKTSNLTKYYASVKNHQTELEIKLNDFVMIESNIDLIKERNVPSSSLSSSLSPAPLPPQQAAASKNTDSLNVLDVLNETSHSNYSLSESEMAKQDSQQATTTSSSAYRHEYVLQIKSIWADSLSATENLMISGKIFLRPSQLNEILSGSEADRGRTFDQNELIEWIDFENRVEMFSVDCVKRKCEVTLDTADSQHTSGSGHLSNLFCNYEYDFRQRELRLVDNKKTTTSSS